MIFKPLTQPGLFLQHLKPRLPVPRHMNPSRRCPRNATDRCFTNHLDAPVTAGGCDMLEERAEKVGMN